MTGVCHGCKSTRGFTLLEVLVVLVIAGIMITLIPPMFSGAVSSSKLKGTVRDLAMNLRETRSRAILRNTEQVVVLDLETPRYRVGSDKPLALPEGVRMAVETVTGPADAGMTQHMLHFFPDGSSSGEMITLSDGKLAYHLQVDWLTGSITISERSHDDG